MANEEPLKTLNMELSIANTKLQYGTIYGIDYEEFVTEASSEAAAAEAEASSEESAAEETTESAEAAE